MGETLGIGDIVDMILHWEWTHDIVDMFFFYSCFLPFILHSFIYSSQICTYIITFFDHIFFEEKK